MREAVKRKLSFSPVPAVWRLCRGATLHKKIIIDANDITFNIFIVMERRKEPKF